ncbi:mediator of RNA polymerase II transcription subunit 25-like isoform X2 [Leptopilina boulardi]|uniref:mediator of RNA polymerase II transcription subunit 25-like isoform X2 n=1 Tax=Leptopilina boulardi TaxID=63433 RepID=UPI0021F61293|nr:mediator of RNA polymerase II transcription subunit 25-like isoform X2 [Leptopilina boulardi]
MVNVPTDHGLQADIIFVIEGTAVNGAYLNDLKTNYLIPTLEYFSQGTIEDREYVPENTSTLYGVVVYHAADCLPSPCTGTLGPYANPHKLLLALDKLEMVGGMGESHANIAEGLATALQCFEDLQVRREPNTAAQKHCILVCNSPPYLTVVQESFKFAGHSIDQLAPLLQDRNINLSILSPRKIPALFKLFEKAGGDLQSSQTKNYAKDPRHLVLLRNYNLKERPVSPISGTGHGTAPNAAQIPLSPLQSNDSPNTNQAAQNIAQPTQNQGAPFRNQAPQNIASVHQPGAPPMAAPMSAGRPNFNPQINAPPNYHPSSMSARATHNWRMRPPGPPFIAPNAAPPASTPGSALLAQLNQPPSLGLNISPFGQRMDGTAGNAIAANAQQQQQQQLSQQQLRMMMQQQQQQQQQNQQQNQQTSMGMQAQQAQNQAVTQLTVSAVSQPTPNQGPHTVTAPQNPGQQSTGTPQVPHPQGQANVGQQPMVMGTERRIIWQGTLEWIEKNKNPNDIQKQTKHVPCQVSIQSKEGEMDLKTDNWPPKLIMQLMPKMLLGTIGNSYLKNSRSVNFYPTPCEALESLIKVMSTGFAGCVHFNTQPPCGIKVLLLLYTADKRSFVGFIPNDQSGFVDRLRKVIQQQKNTQALRHQSQAGAPPGANAMQGGMPTSGISQGGILMSQTNTMAMGGGQITQNVVASNPQQNLATPTGPPGQINLQNANMAGGQQVGAGGGGMMGQQRPQFDDLGMMRQQNLLKIQQLRQTLEAAQQQEAQYKSQLEINIQQSLDVSQQQELQYKQLEQAQRGLNQTGMAGQQANAQRMMRPVMTNSLGLRHLLQQQPQYRQVVGMQQQMVGPRGQMNVRPMEPGNPQGQQFDDVSNYDFLG